MKRIVMIVMVLACLMAATQSAFARLEKRVWTAEDDAAGLRQYNNMTHPTNAVKAHIKPGTVYMYDTETGLPAFVLHCKNPLYIPPKTVVKWKTKVEYQTKTEYVEVPGPTVTVTEWNTVFPSVATPTVPMPQPVVHKRESGGTVFVVQPPNDQNITAIAQGGGGASTSTSTSTGTSTSTSTGTGAGKDGKSGTGVGVGTHGESSSGQSAAADGGSPVINLWKK